MVAVAISDEAVAIQADVIVWDMDALQILHRLRLHKVRATLERAQKRCMAAVLCRLAACLRG